jgi:glycosyltransferase involved in cell wall biosynthesis
MKKVLWLSNVLFPDVCKELNIKVPVVGGWMHSGAETLMNYNPEINLAVASLYPCADLQCISKYAITYYLIPNNSFGNQYYNHSLEKHYAEIIKNFQPDVIHIHGSEYPHSLALVKACGSSKVVLSIQGLVSIYSKYYLGGILDKEVRKNRTLRDFLRNDSLLSQQINMKRRGDYEIELIQSVQHIVGRTSWDESNMWAINPKATYYFCNETLRSSFYEKYWKLDNCRKYSIFLSQAHYPIKGIQQLIQALPIVLEHFPEAKVYVAGNDFVTVPWYRKNGFASYLEKLMLKNKVSKDQIVFLGSLNENQMVEQYLSAHVFVCPSAIENSPNSVGEAQLVGTPCVASYVGGSMDMIKDLETGLLYRFEEIALLAKHICTVFADNDLANSISEKARAAALKRHDKTINASHLNAIYIKIYNEYLTD